MQNIEIVSCDSVILRYEPVIDEKVLDCVQYDFILLSRLEGIIEIVPSYASIWIRFDVQYYSFNTLKEKITVMLSGREVPSRQKGGALYEIPVDYHQGVDLERIANLHHLSVDEAIKIHTGKTYRVYAIGFMVGFAYLGVVDRRIMTPRLKTPRQKVAKGSVAIANSQTAIYPQNSAGGWNIVGITKFDNFENFQIGDRIRFVRE